MNVLYKTTLLITMAVVTWKVMKIEVNTRKRQLILQTIKMLKLLVVLVLLNKSSSMFKRH